MRAFPEKTYSLIAIGILPATILCSLVLADSAGASLQLPWQTLSIIAIVSSMVAGLFLLRHTYLLACRLTEIQALLERYHKGDLSSRLEVRRDDLFRSLAIEVNQVGRSAERRRRRSEERHRNEVAILETMDEGIVLFNERQRVVQLNKAAAALFNIDAAWAVGRGIEEVCRNVALHRLVERAYYDIGELKSEFVLIRGDSERYIQATIRDVQRGSGRLLVLLDVTELRRLENIRRDFIANLSHELRTPVTAISGFVETLREGALDNPDEARRFLEIIHRQARRLSDSFDDLLTLARLEREEELGETELLSVDVVAVVQRAIEPLRPRAATRAMTISVDSPPQALWPVQETALEQAIGNLVENAIKYSVEGDAIEVSIIVDPLVLRIRVRDHGRGIPEHHQARVFERFYRVDKGRNRAEGGTGLGLSIVKHVAQIHGGTASLESTVGRGSTFQITIPKQRRDGVP